jgi:outer membrane protein assembly factor BamB/precorrin-6B methylase 2
MKSAWRGAVLLLLIASFGWMVSAQKADESKPGHWPQWRGPERNSVSKETGLLKTWAAEGPPLAWSVTGIGPGVASAAVAGGRVFTLGKIDDNETLSAFEETTGKKLWASAAGPAVKGESSLMRWLSQRTPTVDGDRVYTVTALGELVCFTVAEGKELWRKNYPKDFGGKTGAWGWCDRPLVDGEQVICTPGGQDATVVALDRKTGEVVWRCAVPGEPRAAYSATTISEAGGVRQYVCFLSKGPVGVAAKDGRFLWRSDKTANGIGNSHTPLVRGEHILFSSGYGGGMALLKFTGDKDEIRSQEVWSSKVAPPAWYDGNILVGEHVYVATGRDLCCVEFATGRIAWQQKAPGIAASSLATAEGLLYVLGNTGDVVLVDASPSQYTERGRFKLPEAVMKPGVTTPVIAGGRLYLRDDDRLFCYDLRGMSPPKPNKEPEPPRPEAGKTSVARPKAADEPDAPFVPTPQDVVERMIEAAGVQRGERVYDLGCGDGRIVVTAAQRHDCRAVGIDIDPECVERTRENIARHSVGALVTVEQRDIFTVDLSDADVVFLYLSPELNERLLPQLAKMKPGARVISHAFGIPGVPADRTVVVHSLEDATEHALHVWRMPLKKR